MSEALPGVEGVVGLLIPEDGLVVPGFVMVPECDSFMLDEPEVLGGVAEPLPADWL